VDSKTPYSKALFVSEVVLKTLTARDLMVPVDQCPRVSENATLREAIMALEATRLQGDPWDYRPRVVLVNDEHSVIGTLRQFEILMALEPKYKELLQTQESKYVSALQMLEASMQKVDDIRILFCLGLNNEFVKSSLKDFDLWSDSFDNMARKASSLKVTQIMTPLSEDQFIDQDAPLTEALHRMLMGNLLSLMVAQDRQSVGVLRIIDIFNETCSAIKLCHV